MALKINVITTSLVTTLILFWTYTCPALAAVPAAPDKLTATAPLETQVALSWPASSSATSYAIYRGVSSGRESQLKSGVPGNTFEDTALDDGKTYYYEITAVNGDGESGRTQETSVTTKAHRPTGLSLKPGHAQVVLNWNASASATGYRVYRDTLGGTGGAASFLTTDTHFTDTGLIDGTTYYYQIAPINPSGENPSGDPMVAVTAGAETSNQTTAMLPGQTALKPDVPTAKVNPTAKGGVGQIVVTWPVAPSTSYAIYRGITSAAETLLDSGLVGNTFTDAGLIHGGTYYYQVATLNAGGPGPRSQEVSATASSPAPTSWTGTIDFGLTGEPIQSCKAYVPDVNRPIQGALFSAFPWSKTPNLRALAEKYNLILFPPMMFNFGTPKNPLYLTTTDDKDHRVAVIDYRWPQLSAQRIVAILNSTAKLFPSHPEIQNTGVVLYGFSEGVDNINMAISPSFDVKTCTVSTSPLANRVLAVVHLSEIDEDRFNPLASMDSIPHLFLASGLSDIYSSLNRGLEDFSLVTHDTLARGLATNQGAPLTVIDNVGVGHGGNPDHPFISIWLDSVLSQRLPATLPVSAPVNLPSWQNSSSWVGSYDITKSNASPWGTAGHGHPGVQMIHNIVSAKSSYTDSRPFTWLPSQNTANVWLTYATTGNMPIFKSEAAPTARASPENK